MNTQPLIATNALGYVRVSTMRQDLSVEAQTESVQRAADYHNMAATEIFSEPGVSGGKPFLERPQALAMLQRAQQLIAEGSAVTIIVPKVDRLGRDTVDVSNTAKLMEELGIRLLLLDINVDTRSPMGRAFMQIAAVFAELELARIRERTQTVLDQKREEGFLTGTVTFGWDAQPTDTLTARGKALCRVVENTTEQTALLDMIGWRRDGWGYNSIAKELNRRGIKTKTGSTWHNGTVRKLLASRTVNDWLTTRNEPRLAA